MAAAGRAPLVRATSRPPWKTLVVKVNTDVDPAVGARHNVQSIPTMADFATNPRPAPPTLPSAEELNRILEALRK